MQSSWTSQYSSYRHMIGRPRLNPRVQLDSIRQNDNRMRQEHRMAKKYVLNFCHSVYCCIRKSSQNYSDSQFPNFLIDSKHFRVANSSCTDKVCVYFRKYKVWSLMIDNGNHKAYIVPLHIVMFVHIQSFKGFRLVIMRYAWLFLCKFAMYLLFIWILNMSRMRKDIKKEKGVFKASCTCQDKILFTTCLQ